MLQAPVKAQLNARGLMKQHACVMRLSGTNLASGAHTAYSTQWQSYCLYVIEWECFIIFLPFPLRYSKVMFKVAQATLGYLRT